MSTRLKAPGAAVLVEGCRDITLDTLRVIPHPERLISTCGGGVELIDCTGTVATQHGLLHLSIEFFETQKYPFLFYI